MKYSGIEVYMHDEDNFVLHFQGTNVLRPELPKDALRDILVKSHREFGLDYPFVEPSEFEYAFHYMKEKGHNRATFGINGSFMFSEKVNI